MQLVFLKINGFKFVKSFVKSQHNDLTESSQFGEPEEDSLISEAKKLFGEELIEIID